jgi:hypothetical protein
MSTTSRRFLRPLAPVTLALVALAPVALASVSLASVSLASVSLALGVPPLAAAASAPLQDGTPPVEDERPLIEELIDELDGLLGDRKGLEDARGVALVDQLLKEYPASGPKDRSDVVEALGDCLEVRRNSLEDGSPNERLQRAAAVALGRMGPESATVLVKHIDHKALRDAHGAHGDLLRSVGRVQAEKGIKPLMGMLQCGNYGIEAAAAQGLGMYVGLESKGRKEIFEELLKTIMPLEQVIEQGEGGDANYDEIRKRYDTLAASIRNSLAALSGHEERGFNAWRQWWNDNKKRDWDEGR